MNANALAEIQSQPHPPMKDPWRKVLLVFVLFLIMIGTTGSPKVKNNGLLTLWTIGVALIGLCIGIAFSLVLRSFAKTVRDQEITIEAPATSSSQHLPPPYESCLAEGENKDELPSYSEAVATTSQKQNQPAEVTVVTVDETKK